MTEFDEPYEPELSFNAVLTLDLESFQSDGHPVESVDEEQKTAPLVVAADYTMGTISMKTPPYVDTIVLKKREVRVLVKTLLAALEVEADWGDDLGEIR